MALKSIPEHYVTEFETNWQHKAGQRMSLLKDCVVIDQVAGKEKVYNKIGSVEFQVTTGRAEETRENNVETEKRWLRPYPYDSGAQIYDQWDETFLGEIAKPSHALIEEHARAVGGTGSSVATLGIETDDDAFSASAVTISSAINSAVTPIAGYGAEYAALAANTVVYAKLGLSSGSYTAGKKVGFRLEYLLP